MIGPREALAMAERHAWWCRVTFNATPDEIVHELSVWRKRYTVALSDHTINMVAHHVATAPAEVHA